MTKMLRCLVLAAGVTAQVSAELVYDTTFPEPNGSLPADWVARVGGVGTPGFYVDSSGDFRYDNGVTPGIAEYAGALSNGGDSAALTDFTVETLLRKADTGTGFAGIVGRSQATANNFYHVRLRANNQLEMYRNVSGAFTQLGTTQIVAPGSEYVSGQTWRLRVDFVGSQITAELFNHNDQSVAFLSESDATFFSGSVGVRGSSPVVWEAFSVRTAIPEPSTASLLLVGFVALYRRRR